MASYEVVLTDEQGRNPFWPQYGYPGPVIAPPQHEPDPPVPAAPGRSDPIILREEPGPARSRNLEVSSSDWGSVGLLQTPTARMREAGSLSAGDHAPKRLKSLLGEEESQTQHG